VTLILELTILNVGQGTGLPCLVRFEVLTAVIGMITVYWNETPCGLIDTLPSNIGILLLNYMVSSQTTVVIFSLAFLRLSKWRGITTGLS
jgi:hypothetical protein